VGNGRGRVAEREVVDRMAVLEELPRLAVEEPRAPAVVGGVVDTVTPEAPIELVERLVTVGPILLRRRTAEPEVVAGEHAVDRVADERHRCDGPPGCGEGLR